MSAFERCNYHVHLTSWRECRRKYFWREFLQRFSDPGRLIGPFLAPWQYFWQKYEVLLDWAQVKSTDIAKTFDSKLFRQSVICICE